MGTSSVDNVRDQWRERALAAVEPHRTALLVIDVQRDFCDENGALAALGSDVTPCRDAASRISDFLPAIRPLVAFVAFFQLVYDPSRMSDPQRERLIKNGKPVICVPGSAGVELAIPAGPDDLLFQKHRYSAFSNTTFTDLLRERSITSIAVTGVDTHICVEGTVRDGYDLGYRMIVLSDLVATRRSESARHDNSLSLCDRYFGIALRSTEFAALCDPQASSLAHKGAPR